MCFLWNSLNGGIFRIKQHLVGGHRNAKACPEHVRTEIQESMNKKIKSKAAYEHYASFR